jgi:hypothetical protein
MRQYPSGARKVYVNSSGKVAQSIPQTYKFEDPIPSSPDKGQIISNPELSGPIIPPISPKLRLLAHALEIPTPLLRDNKIFERSSAANMSDGALGASTSALKEASLISISSGGASSTSRPTAPLIPDQITDRDIRGDIDARRKEWGLLQMELPRSCIVAMCGGQHMYDLTPENERDQAVFRKAMKVAGRKGSSLARDRRCLQKYKEYRRIQGITTPPFPIPAAVATNCAQYYMETSEAFSKGAGGSIGPGMIAAFNHLRLHFGLEVDLEAPVAASIEKHTSSGSSGTEPVPLWIWAKVEEQCNGPNNPLRFYMRNLWLMIYTSTRAQDFHRATYCTRYSIPRATGILEMSVVKSGEQHVVVGISDSGLFGKLPWLQEHLHAIRDFGFSTPAFDGDIRKSTAFARSRMDPDAFGKLVPKLIEYAGVSSATIKSLAITGHSPHATFDSIAAVLGWNSTARNDLGRWKHQGGKSVMHHRYATKASAINQMYIRATLIEAVRDICPPPFDDGFDISHMRDSPLFEFSLYVGPFVTFSSLRKDGEMGVDALFVD